jgi:muramoyltetrapeptide carboxypeptidase
MKRRHFLGGAALTAALLPFSEMAGANVGSQQQRLLPKQLNKGDVVGLVSPSAASDDPFNYQLARETLEALGFKVKMGAHAEARYGHLAGTDAERAADVNAMFADPEVNGIVCVRGGSGAARILPLIDYATVRRNPKVFLGFSDITALHCALHAQTGLVTFHGPTGASSWNSFNVDQFERMFFKRELLEFRNKRHTGDELVQRQNRTHTIHAGKVQGQLVGGNLAVLTGIAGSPYVPDFTGKILFLEEVSEAPYRVDRMLSTLKLMGALDKIAGFIFGECTDCKPGNGYGSLTLEQILDDYIRPLKIPAYRGAMIGHIREQFIVPVGGKVEMDADAGTFRLLESVFQA